LGVGFPNGQGARSTFADIYTNCIWGDGSPGNPRSGSGSNPDIAKPYVDFVSSAIQKFAINFVLDVGCGDWEMWRDYKFENANYTGVDVVEELIVANTEKYGSENRSFHVSSFNASLQNSELLLCKDVLQHLSSVDTDQLLLQLSKFKYLVFQNDKCSQDNKNNLEIETGGWRPVDLKSTFFDGRLKDFELIGEVCYSPFASSDYFKEVLMFKNLTSRFL
jgi:hypothetical protein